MSGPKFQPPPYNLTREDENLKPMSEPFVSWRALFKTNQYFLPCELGCIGTFWQPIGKPEEKIHRKLSILQKCDLYLNPFSNKKGPLVNLRGRKCAPSGSHIPVPTFPLWYPRSSFMMYSCNHDVTYIIGSCIISLSNYKLIQKTIHVTIH